MKFLAKISEFTVYFCRPYITCFLLTNENKKQWNDMHISKPYFTKNIKGKKIFYI